MLSVIMLSVIMLNVTYATNKLIMLSVIMLSFIMLSVVAPSLGWSKKYVAKIVYYIKFEFSQHKKNWDIRCHLGTKSGPDFPFILIVRKISETKGKKIMRFFVRIGQLIMNVQSRWVRQNDIFNESFYGKKWHFQLVSFDTWLQCYYHITIEINYLIFAPTKHSLL